MNIQNLQTIFNMECNIIVLNATEKGWETIESLPPEKRRIDVWWWNDATSQLMLLFAYLMTRDEKWTDAVIRVIAVCYDRKSEKNLEDLKHTLEEIRIAAEPEILENATAESITQYSEDAAMVFLPFQLHDRQISAPFDAKIEDLLSKLPISAMVLAAEDIHLDAEPEEGKPAEIAEALDAIEEAKKRSQEMKKDAEKAEHAALEAEKKLAQMIESAGPGAGREVMERIEKTAKDADDERKKAIIAAQKAKKALSTAQQQIAREAEAIGIAPPKSGQDAEKKEES